MVCKMGQKRERNQDSEAWASSYPLFKLEGLLAYPSLPSSPWTGGAKRVFDQYVLLATMWQRRVATSITIIFMLSRKNEEGGSGDISILKSPRKWV